MSRERDVTFGEVYAFLIRGAWLALLTALIAAATAYYFVSQQAPTYEASARVLVGPVLQGARSAVTDPEVLVLAATSHEVMQDAVALLANDPSASRAADAGALRSRTSARYLVGTTSRVIEVSITGLDPLLAEREAQAVIRALIGWEVGQARRAAASAAEAASQRLAVIETEIASKAAAAPDNPDLIRLRELREPALREMLQAQALATSPAPALQFFDSTVGPAVQVGPRPVYMAALAAVFGFVLGYSLFLLMESLDGRVRSADAVRRLTSARVIDVSYQRRDRARPMDRAAGTVSAMLWGHGPHPGPARPLTVIVTSVDKTPAINEFAVSLVQRLAFEGVSTSLVLPDMKPTVTRTSTSGPFKAPDGSGPFVSIGLDVPKRVTDSSLEVIRRSAPSDVARLMMPDALRDWLRSEASQLDVAVVALPPAGTALPPPAVTVATAVVLIVPSSASRNDAASMLSSMEKVGERLVAVLAVHPSALGRPIARTSEASSLTARTARRAQV